MVKKIVSFFISASITCCILAQTAPQEKTIFDVMAQDNLRTTMRIEEKKEPTLSRKTFYHILHNTLEKQKNLSPEKRRRLAFNLLSEYERDNPSNNPGVLDTTSWQDLEMLSGPKSNLSHYLAGEIDNTATEIGRLIFFKRIIQPHSCAQELYKTQEVVKTFAYNEQLFLDTQHYLEQLKQHENLVLCLWEEDIYESILKQNSLSIPYAPAASDWMDRSTYLVEFLNTGRLGSILGLNAVKALATLSVPAEGIAYLSGSSYYQRIKQFNTDSGFKAVAILSMTGYILSKCEKQYPENKKLETFSNIVSPPMGGVDVLYIPDQLRSEATFKKGLQTKLIAIAQYISTLKRISYLTQDYPALVTQFPKIAQLSYDLEELCKQSSEIKQLLGLLNTHTFKGKPRLLSLYGPMYVAYKLATKFKNTLVPFMITIGELDAYLSCAKLIKEFEAKNIQYCFPEYLTKQSAPYIEAKDFWNPAIKPHKVVPSSVTIGGEERQNVIVTGPNAGGKSTVVKGLIINLIMAQSLGIAAARSFKLTPFKTIMTYLNITDDIAAGNSHFKAGVLRAQELISAAEKHTGTDFSFTAVDEVFNGTTFKEGQAAAYSLIEQLGNYPNNMCITVTHFPKVTLLEERTTDYTNYRVTVKKNKFGSIFYPYKLERGVSNQAIALDILKEEGFGATFLNKAQEILNES